MVLQVLGGFPVFVFFGRCNFGQGAVTLSNRPLQTSASTAKELELSGGRRRKEARAIVFGLAVGTEVTFKVTLPYLRPQEGEKQRFGHGISCLSAGPTLHNNY